MNNYYVEDYAILTPKNALSGIGSGKGREEKYSLDSSILSVSINGNETQNLTLEWVDLRFGQAPYFNCGCGYRATKLYRAPNSAEWKCRKCQKLKYRSGLLNNKSIAGKALRTFAKITKLAEDRANMSKIFYKGAYTKRFNRFLDDCTEVGLMDIVENARNLEEIVKTKVF